MYRFSFENEAAVGLRGAFTYINRIEASLSDVYMAFVFPQKRAVGSGQQAPYMHVFGSSDKGSSHPSTFSFVLEAPFLDYIDLSKRLPGSAGSPHPAPFPPGAAPTASPFINRAAAEALRYASTNIVISVDAAQISNVQRMLFDKSSFLLLAELNVIGADPANDAFVSSASNAEDNNFLDLDRLDALSRSIAETSKRYISFQRAITVGRSKGAASRTEHFEPRTCSSVVRLPVHRHFTDMTSIAYFDLLSEVLRWDFSPLGERIKQPQFSIFSLLGSLSSLSTLPPSISLHSRIPIQRVQIPDPGKFLDQMVADIKPTLSGKGQVVGDIFLVSTVSRMKFNQADSHPAGAGGSEQHQSERYSREYGGGARDADGASSESLNGFAFQSALEARYSEYLPYFFCPLLTHQACDQSIWYSCGSSSHDVLQDSRAKVLPGNPVVAQLLNYYEAKIAGRDADDAGIPIVPALQGLARAMREVYPPRDSQHLQLLRHLLSATGFASSSANLAGEPQVCAFLSSFSAYPMFEWELSVATKDVGAIIEDVKHAGAGICLLKTRGLDMTIQKAFSTKCVGIARFQDINVLTLLKFTQPLRLRGDISIRSLGAETRQWARPLAALPPPGNVTPGPPSQTQSHLTPFQRAPAPRSPSPMGGASFLSASEGQGTLGRIVGITNALSALSAEGSAAPPAPRPLPRFGPARHDSQGSEGPSHAPARAGSQEPSSIDLDTPSQPSVPRSSQIGRPRPPASESLQENRGAGELAGPEAHPSRATIDPAADAANEADVASLSLAALEGRTGRDSASAACSASPANTTVSMIRAALAALRGTTVDGRLGYSVDLGNSRSDAPGALAALPEAELLPDSLADSISLAGVRIDELALRLDESGVRGDLSATELLRSQAPALTAADKQALERLIRFVENRAGGSVADQLSAGRAGASLAAAGGVSGRQGDIRGGAASQVAAEPGRSFGQPELSAGPNVGLAQTPDSAVLPVGLANRPGGTGFASSAPSLTSVANELASAAVDRSRPSGESADRQSRRKEGGRAGAYPQAAFIIPPSTPGDDASVAGLPGGTQARLTQGSEETGAQGQKAQGQAPLSPKLPDSGANCLSFLGDSDDDLNEPISTSTQANDLLSFYSAYYRAFVLLRGSAELPSSGAEVVKITPHSQIPPL